MSKTEVTILGCGSSVGVPRIDGYWGRANKNNPKNLEIINDFIQQNINQYLKEFNPNHYIEVKLESLALKS